MAATEGATVYQLKVTLKWTKPPIWRRVLVPSSITLSGLHDVLQVSMGWDDEHLHQFVTGKRGAETRYALPDPEWPDDALDESRVRLDSVLTTPKAKLVYEYDFGDGWYHDVVLEKIVPADPNAPQPRCIAGALACPPEDCGGVWGYNEIVEMLAHPTEHAGDERLEWLEEGYGEGGYDPEAFDLAAINHKLAALSRRRGR